MTEPQFDNKLLARRFLEEVVNGRALDRLPEFLAPEYVAEYGNIIGIEGAREHALAFFNCYPDLLVTIDGQLAEGDTVVTWFTVRGTHLGEYGGVPPSGKKITLRAVNIQRIRAGRISEQWGGSNSLEALMELGVVRFVADRGCVNGCSQSGPISPTGERAVP
jgi:steroid delta-isomerase-like uncharacterized protein